MNNLKTSPFPAFSDFYPGTWLEDSNRQVWLVMKTDQINNIDGMLVNIFNGQTIHYNQLTGPIKPITAQEIMW